MEKISENKLLDGLFGSIALLGSATAWLILAGLASFFNHSFLMWILISFAFVMVAIWAVVHVIPVFWVNIIKPFFEWFVNLVE